VEDNPGRFNASGNIAPDKTLATFMQQIAVMRAQIDYIVAALKYEMEAKYPDADFSGMDQTVANNANRYLRQMTKDLGLTITETQEANPPSSE
jgi:hypothetical protein